MRSHLAISDAHLQQAHREAGLPIALDAALAIPALSIALMNTAHAIARRGPKPVLPRGLHRLASDAQRLAANDKD